MYSDLTYDKNLIPPFKPGQGITDEQWERIFKKNDGEVVRESLMERTVEVKNGLHITFKKKYAV